jgi:hypothetical protein
MDDTDHYVEVRYSKDGGRNWSNWKRRSLGAIGEYQKRIKLKRMGVARTWVFDIKVSSPRKRDLLGAVVTVERTDG